MSKPGRSRKLTDFVSHGIWCCCFRSADSLQENVFNRRNVSVWRTENTRSQLPTKINPSQLSSESKNQPLSLSYLYSFFYFGIPDKRSNQSMSKDSSRISLLYVMNSRLKCLENLDDAIKVCNSKWDDLILATLLY